MDRDIFLYLRRKRLSDTQKVNSLFVLAYMKMNGWHLHQYSLLLENLNISLPDSESCDVDEFIATLKKYNCGLTLEDLIELFEFVISPSDRIVTGAVYTPSAVRKTIISRCLGKFEVCRLNTIRIADIACGCGGFLMDAAKYIHEQTNKSFLDIYRDNIFGIDIQNYSIERTKILLSLLALSCGENFVFDFNLIEADTLDYCSECWDRQYTGFNVIVGNPPYVCSRNVDEVTKTKMLKYDVCKTGHPDLYIPFFQIALEMLEDNGVLGYITMNSFLRSINGRALREYFSSEGYNICIVDFRGHQIFRTKSTYTCLFYLDKANRDRKVFYSTNECGELSIEPVFAELSYDELNNKQGWSLNDYCNTIHLESIGISIGQYCQSRHGIATLSNKTYIFNPQSEEENHYILEKDRKLYYIEKSICRDIVNSNKLNSNVSFESIVEKVIYPYKIDQDGRACVFNQDVMREFFPGTYSYLISQRSELSKRDKGKTQEYPAWYSYGRTQSLVMPAFKLFFPKFANKPLNCVLCDDKDLLLYNGIAFVSEDVEKLKILKKIIESHIFWDYIVANSKPYSSGYFSISGVNIKNFNIPYFTEEEMNSLLTLQNKDDIEDFLYSFYA